MPKTRFLLMLNIGQGVDCLEIDPQGECLQWQSFASDVDLPPLAAKQDMIVLLPGQMIFSRAINLPKTNRAQREKAIPYLIENQLLSRPQHMHTLLHRLDTLHYQLMAIDRKSMQAWMEKINCLAGRPVALIADYLALPFSQGVWTIAIMHHIARVRIGQYTGFSCELADLHFLLSRYMRENGAPLSLTVMGKTTMDFSTLEPAVKVTYAEQWSFDASLWQGQQAMNWLPIISRESKNRLRCYWHWAGYAFATWLLLGLLTQGSLWWLRQHQSLQLSAQLAAFKHGARAVTIEDPAISLLRDVLQVLPHRLLLIDSIDFRAKTLSLTLQSSSLSDLSNYVKKLHTLGFHVEQSAVSSTDKKSRVLLRVSVR